MADDALSLSALRQVYSAIIQGYVATSYKGRPLYIRHFSPIEQAEIDERHSEFYHKAKDEGLTTEAEQLAELKRQKVWGDAEDLEVKSLKFSLDELVNIKRTLQFPSQLRKITKEIEEAEKKYLDKIKEKMSLLTLTCEAYASQKVNEVYIYKSLYQNRELTEPFFGEDEYNELDRSEIGELINTYNSKIAEFSDLNLQRVSVTGFFQDYFGLCNDDVSSFYGKPIVFLTYYQSTLARHGKYFCKLFSSELRPPDNIIHDPEKIIDWITTSSNAKKLSESSESKGEGGAASFVGASKEDLKEMGMESKAMSIETVAKEKGKTGLNMQEMMEMAGVS